MASMQCDITELIEKLSDEARLYLLRRMASRNLTLRQALVELVIEISKEISPSPGRKDSVLSTQTISR